MQDKIKTIVILLGSAALALAPSSATGQFNNPPTANADALEVWVCQDKAIDVVANDTDPEGNYPLTVTSVGVSYLGFLSVTSASKITFYASDIPGNDVVAYTVQDSLGATSTGYLYLFSKSRLCP
jgi:hypothetical protein